MSKENIVPPDVSVPTTDENPEILTDLAPKQDLAPAQQSQTSLEEDPINALQKATPEQLQQIVDAADELSSNFQSDSASAKVAFEEISQILKDDSKDFATKQDNILEIGQKTPDSALKVFAHISKQIISSEVESEEKKQAVESVIEEFSFLKSGQERVAEESMEMAINAGEQIITSDLSDEIKSFFKIGFREALEEIQKLKNSEKESEPQKLEDLDELEAKQYQADLDNSEKKEPKKSMSFEDIKKISKPALRVGIAVAIAFLVPGMGFPIAVAFLVLTSPKEEKETAILAELKLEEEKNLIDGKTLEEFCDNLKNKVASLSEEEKDLDTEIGKKAGNVVEEESKNLKSANEVLQNTKSAIERMNDGFEQEQVEEEQIDSEHVGEEILQETSLSQPDQDLSDEQEKEISSQPTQEESKEQEGKDSVDPNNQTSQDMKAVIEGLKGAGQFEESNPNEPKKSDAPDFADQEPSKDRQK
jgi:hypothetical protein